MTAGTWFCEAPDHVGDRHIRNPDARFSKRETYMRADGGQRVHERVLYRCCRACMARETGVDLQVGMFT